MLIWKIWIKIKIIDKAKAFFNDGKHHDDLTI